LSKNKRNIYEPFAIRLNRDIRFYKKKTAKKSSTKIIIDRVTSNTRSHLWENIFFFQKKTTIINKFIFIIWNVPHLKNKNRSTSCYLFVTNVEKKITVKLPFGCWQGLFLNYKNFMIKPLKAILTWFQINQLWTGYELHSYFRFILLSLHTFWLPVPNKLKYYYESCKTNN
jgi:hypothetical protein